MLAPSPAAAEAQQQHQDFPSFLHEEEIIPESPPPPIKLHSSEFVWGGGREMLLAPAEEEQDHQEHLEQQEEDFYGKDDFIAATPQEEEEEEGERQLPEEDVITRLQVVSALSSFNHSVVAAKEHFASSSFFPWRSSPVVGSSSPAVATGDVSIRPARSLSPLVDQKHEEQQQFSSQHYPLPQPAVIVVNCAPSSSAPPPVSSSSSSSSEELFRDPNLFSHLASLVSPSQDDAEISALRTNRNENILNILSDNRDELSQPFIVTSVSYKATLVNCNKNEETCLHLPLVFSAFNKKKQSTGAATSSLQIDQVDDAVKSNFVLIHVRFGTCNVSIKVYRKGLVQLYGIADTPHHTANEIAKFVLDFVLVVINEHFGESSSFYLEGVEALCVAATHLGVSDFGVGLDLDSIEKIYWFASRKTPLRLKTSRHSKNGSLTVNFTSSSSNKLGTAIFHATGTVQLMGMSSNAATCVAFQLVDLMTVFPACVVENEKKRRIRIQPTIAEIKKARRLQRQGGGGEGGGAAAASASAAPRRSRCKVEEEEDWEMEDRNNNDDDDDDDSDFGSNKKKNNKKKRKQPASSTSSTSVFAAAAAAAASSSSSGPRNYETNSKKQRMSHLFDSLFNGDDDKQ